MWQNLRFCNKSQTERPIMETGSTANTYGYARVSTDDQNEDRQLVALRAAAVPETLGKAGLLLEDSNPETAAAAIDRVLRDEGLRAYLKAGREEQLRKYRYEAVSRRMTECIDKFIIRQTY